MNQDLLNVDVAIVGAGLVGATLALALKNTGLNIALIDNQTQESLQKSLTSSSSVNEFEPRVSAISSDQ